MLVNSYLAYLLGLLQAIKAIREECLMDEEIPDDAIHKLTTKAEIFIVGLNAKSFNKQTDGL